MKIRISDEAVAAWCNSQRARFSMMPMSANDLRNFDSAAFEENRKNLADVTTLIVAEAVAAERERCARIAETTASEPTKFDDAYSAIREFAAFDTAERIAAAIRGGE